MFFPSSVLDRSAIQAVDFLKDKGCKNIKFMCIIAAPEGLDALRTAHPDIDIYVGNLDEKLNEDAYIVPGLGDAGDRIDLRKVVRGIFLFLSILT